MEDKLREAYQCSHCGYIIDKAMFDHFVDYLLAKFKEVCPRCEENPEWKSITLVIKE